MSESKPITIPFSTWLWAYERMLHYLQKKGLDPKDFVHWFVEESTRIGSDICRICGSSKDVKEFEKLLLCAECIEREEAKKRD